MGVFTDLTPDESYRYLYHYTSSATLGLILDKGQLRLGPYGNTNDPRENQVFPPAIPASSQDARDAGTTLERVLADADHAIRGRVKMTCLTRDRRSADDDVHFHRGWGRARMWQDYADRHRGACIVFDALALCRAIQDAAGEAQLHSGDVEYVSDWSAGVPEIALPLVNPYSRSAFNTVVDQKIKDRHRDLFFRKNDDWATENEHRFVVVDDRKELLADIREALVGVAIGMDFPPQEASVLQYRLNKIGRPSLPVKQVKWPGGRPIVEPHE